MSTVKKVAFLVDGSFYPIRNGTDYSIDTLMKALARHDKEIQPVLALNWRGWDNPSLYNNRPFETLYVPAKHLYEDDGVLEYVMNIRDISYIHIYNAEEVINLCERLHNAGVYVIYEAVNIDHVLNTALGENEDTVTRSRRMQQKAMRMADMVMCRSEADKSHIEKMGIAVNKVRVYRGAIDTKVIKFHKKRSRRGRVVFMGHMYYPPNENALNRITKHILPRLKQIDSQYTITIIGNTPPKMVEKYSRLGILFRGGVDNLNKELESYDIAISPLFEGSGTRLKLLDFLASGIPTIGTRVSIEGLHEGIEDVLIVESEMSLYAERIDMLMHDTLMYNKLQIDGRKYIEDYYDWNKNLQPFLDIYRYN